MSSAEAAHLSDAGVATQVQPCHPFILQPHSQAGRIERVLCRLPPVDAEQQADLDVWRDQRQGKAGPGCLGGSKAG